MKFISQNGHFMIKSKKEPKTKTEKMYDGNNKNHKFKFAISNIKILWIYNWDVAIIKF